MFTSRKRQKDARDASQETNASGSAVGDDFGLSERSDAELEEMTKQILKEMDVKLIVNVMEGMDRTKMLQICYQYQQQKMKEESAAQYCHRIKKSLERKEDCKKLLESLRVTMTNNNVPWINEFGNEGGFQLLTSLMGKLLRRLDTIRSKSAAAAAAADSEEDTQHNSQQNAQEEEHCVSCLLETIRATRNCLNCQPGIRFLFHPGSRLCFKLVETLFMASSVSDERFRQFNYCYSQLMKLTLPLLFTIPFVDNDNNTAEDNSNDGISGRILLSSELTAFAEQRNVPRFACVINCLRFDDPQITHKALVFINSFLSTAADDENDWRVRILWRGEFLSAGLKTLIPNIECLAEKNEKLKKVFKQFEEAQLKDNKRLKECFTNLQNDVHDLDSCTNMLLSSCKNSDCEHILLQLLLKLLLVSDRKYKRATYFSVINKCVSSVAFGDTALDQDTEKQSVFTGGDLDDEFDKMERDDGIKRLNKRLDSAVEEKQEAVSLQIKYYEKLKELQHECSELRKIAPSGRALPPATVLDLPLPKELGKIVNGTQNHGIAAGVAFPTGPGCPPPPPPPPPPPALLMPDHKRNKLATTAGGSVPPPPPPPPPPSALRPGRGGPPIPPPPPPAFGTPPNAFLHAASPELPDYLKKKSGKQPEVPMKKLPWNAAIIRPNALNKNSLWAQIDEKEVASEDVFDFLKAKFSATGRMNCLPMNLAKRPPSKAKTPLVIQDAKMLQALAILQGSCKLSFKRWRNAILEVDEKALNAELVDKLKSALPPLEMINRLKKSTDDEMQRMPEGEQFVATLSSINGLPLRLEAIHLKLCWSEAFGELKSGITTVTEACEELLKSQGLKHFINLVLLVGNFMGRTKNSKDAFAFELSVLNKLVDTRDCDNSETLLHGLIRLLHRKFNGKFTTFALDDFHHVSKACRVDVSELSKNKIDQVRNSIEKVATYLSGYKMQAENDRFNERIGAFVKQAKEDLVTVDSLWENMQRKWSAVQAYLCFDPKKYAMDRLFADVHTFKGHYQNARAEVLKDQLKGAVDGREGAKVSSRKPFKPIQPIASEAAKRAQQRNSTSSRRELLLSNEGGGGGSTATTPARPQATKIGTTPNAAPFGAKDAGGDGGVIDKIEQMLEEGMYRIECQKRPFRVRRKGQPTVYVSVADDVNNATPTTAADSVKKPVVNVVVADQEERDDDEVLPKKAVVNEYLNVPSSVDLLLRLRGLDGD
ncbi:hypothetical protein niasHS_007133 [Heterodera schachtii]|uniref:FH2 domain-containing protein n=1 Tax=Heterodera schachtii TaxID=97005 RepID=A0ABD2JL46_HETSC